MLNQTRVFHANRLLERMVRDAAKTTARGKPRGVREHANSVPGHPNARFRLAKFSEEHLTFIATEIATEPAGTGCDENGPSTLWRSRKTEEMSLSGMEQDELRPPLTNQGDAVLK